MRGVLSVLLIVAGLFASPAMSGEIGPVVPKATGEPHPEGNLFMRVNHMKLMVHDRDLTMHDGDRQISYSLKACVECHAVNGEDAQPVSVENDKHFCRVCHDYAAVKIDCFECHNSKPETSSSAMLKPELPDSAELAAYLKEAGE
jgi:hypothetical protein